MPRISRGLGDEQIYHIINRGNRKAEVFHDKNDYEKFLDLLKIAKDKFKIEIYAYCLMPNHFHLVLCSKQSKHISSMMQWLGTSYVRYYNKKYETTGHLWQGRFKSFIVQSDEYLLTLLKYVDTNPKRANLVQNPLDYDYSSAYTRSNKIINTLIDSIEITSDFDYEIFIKQEIEQKELDAIRNSLNRQAPYGNEEWVKSISSKYKLESTLNPRGRPRKVIK